METVHVDLDTTALRVADKLSAVNDHLRARGLAVVWQPVTGRQGGHGLSLVRVPAPTVIFDEAECTPVCGLITPHLGEVERMLDRTIAALKH